MASHIGICSHCEIEVFVDKNVVRAHTVPGTSFRCPKSGSAYDLRQRKINREPV